MNNGAHGNFTFLTPPQVAPIEGLTTENFLLVSGERLPRLHKCIVNKLNSVKERTNDYDTKYLNLCVAYNPLDELWESAKKSFPPKNSLIIYGYQSLLI